MQEQSLENTGPTCDDTTTCGRSRHTHTHTHDFRVDLICGGFPCQDISVAGKGAGLAGARSGLWREFARIIGELQPSYIIVENVPALTARGLGTVLGEISSLGYDAEWHVIPASAVGAPHRRERIWIVGYARGEPAGGGIAAGTFERGEATPSAWPVDTGHASCGRTYARQPNVADSQSVSGGARLCEDESKRDGSRDVSYPNDAGRQQQRRPKSVRAEQFAIERSGWWLSEPDVGRVAHGVPSRVDRLRCLGNAVVPQVVEAIGRAIIEAKETGCA